MPRTLLAAMIFCLLTGSGMGTVHANPSMLTVQSPGQQCRAAIGAAERGHAIPAQLMSAIGRVESGKRDPGTGAWGAWPWTINAEGQGYYFDTKAEAIAAVQALQAQGVRSIDVGCMQVNLKYHPEAFPTLDTAFEPATNADYAARFLVQLHEQTGDWTQATANYHSADPAEGGPYAAKVTAVWPEEQRKAGMTPLPLVGPLAGPFAGAGFARSPLSGQLVHGAPPLAGRQQPRMFAMNGKMPAVGTASGMMQTEGSRGGIAMKGGGMTSPLIAPLGMMQGGTIPAGTLPPGGIMNAGVTRVPATAPASAAGQFAANPGRGLAFYRAVPIGVTAAMMRPSTRIASRITMR